MGIVDCFMAGYRSGFHGCVIASLSNPDLFRSNRHLVASTDISVSKWAGDDLELLAHVQDAESGEVLATGRRTLAFAGKRAASFEGVTLPIEGLSERAVYATLCVVHKGVVTATSTTPSVAAFDVDQALLETSEPTRADERLLGLEPGYTQEVLCEALRRAVSEWHPDRFRDSSDELRAVATAQTRRLIDARRRLMEEARS